MLEAGRLESPSVFLYTQSPTKVVDFCTSPKASLALSIKKKEKNRCLGALRETEMG